MKPTGPTSKGLNRGRFVASSRCHATASEKHSYTMAAQAHMRATEIAPAHYLGHLGLPSYPRPAVGPKFKRGAKFVLSPNFKQARPIFCTKKPKTSASQTETWFPPTRPIPIRTPWAPKLPLHQPRNPGVLHLPPHTTHQPPPSSITPEPIPRRRRPPQPQPQRLNG